MTKIPETDVRRMEVVTAAHDLRNRLSTARCQVFQLRSQARTTALDTNCENVMASLDRALSRTSTLLEELLEVMADDIRVPEGPTCGADLVQVARRLIARRAYRGCQRSLAVLTPLTTLTGSWDARRLQMVLEVLLDNAIAYSYHGLPVFVEIMADEDWATLIVRDRSSGICAEDLPHVFEPFYRGRNAASHPAGLGLGLPTARLIVEQYAGMLDVESREGMGSSFTVRLPLK